MNLRGGAAALGLLAVAASAVFWWWPRPRILTVCVFPDAAFRQRPNWRQTVESRMAAVSQIWSRQVGIQWRIRQLLADDPTSYVPGLEARRAELSNDTGCPADLLLALSGIAAAQAGGAVNPFSHAALVVDDPRQDEQANVQNLSRQLTRLFGAPDESPSSVPGSEFPERTRRLIRRLRGYNFAAGVHALEGSWDGRAAGALAEAYGGVSAHPLARAHLLMALALVSDGRPAAALPHLQQAVMADPRNVPARLNLASALAQDSRQEEAAATLREGMRALPQNSSLHAALANLLAPTDREGAAQEFRTAIRLDPANAQLYCGLGYLLSAPADGHMDDAVAMFESALRIDPQLRPAQQGLVQALHVRAQVLAAVDRYRALAGRSPAAAAAQYNLGVAEMQAGHIDEAARAFIRATALQPGMGTAHANLALLRFARQDYAGSWRELREAQAAGIQPDARFLAKLREKLPQ